MSAKGRFVSDARDMLRIHHFQNWGNPRRLAAIAWPHCHDLLALEGKLKGHQQLVQHLYEHLERRFVLEGIADAENVSKNSAQQI